MLSRSFLDFSVGVGAFVIGLSQVSSFMLYTQEIIFIIFFRNGCRVHRFILLSKLNDVHVGFVTPPFPLLRLCIPLFAVAEGWLLLDIG